MDESPEQKYSRLQSEIQRAILVSYPNADRKGCPGDATVRGFAKNPDSITDADEIDEHSAWYHVTHCSPCYASFLQLRDAERVRGHERQRITRRAMFATSGVAAVAGVAWLVIRRERVNTVELDLDKYAAFRGANDGGQSRSKLELPRGRMNLTLKLPSGSPDGMYHVELRKANTGESIFAKAVPAKSEQSVLKLHFDVDLYVSRGVYTLAMRNDHRDAWRYYPLSVL